MRRPSPLSFSKVLVGNLPLSSCLSAFIRHPYAFKYLWTPDRGIQGQAKSGSQVAGVTKKGIEPFRGDIPFLSFSKSFIGNPEVLNAVDPGSQVAGVTDLRGKYIEGFPSCYLDS